VAWIMLTIGLATCAELPDLNEDDRLLADELRARGARVHAVVWNDPAVAWDRFDAVLVRSCWDYHLLLPSFLEWLAVLESEAVTLWNPPALLRSNARKTYLRDLERAGVAIVPTTFLERGSRVGLAALLAERGWTQAVVKPAVSASAHRTELVSAATAAAAQPAFDALLADGDVLVQRFMPEVSTRGEWSLIFIDGAFSHAALKRPAPGDFRVQAELGGSVSREQPPPPLLRQAQRLLQEVPPAWLFARVDGLDLAGRFTLMELELIEPFLFLADAPGAAARLAEALLRRTPRRDAP
jgi:glutathione synthase/RimK-type ligase-like ATP-grasp enzyme